MRTIFADFCTDILSFPFFLPVSWQIFYIYDTQISTKNIYRFLIKQTGHHWTYAKKWPISPVHVLHFLVCERNHRGEKDRGEKERVSLPSQLERTPQLCSWWLHWDHYVAVSKQDFIYSVTGTVKSQCIYLPGTSICNVSHPSKNSNFLFTAYTVYKADLIQELNINVNLVFHNFKKIVISFQEHMKSIFCCNTRRFFFPVDIINTVKLILYI